MISFNILERPIVSKDCVDCNLNKNNGMIIVVIDFEKHANWENFDNS